MADHEESYFLKISFLIFIGFFASRHFSFNPVPTRPTGEQPTDQQATDTQTPDKRRPNSAIRNGPLHPAKMYTAGPDDQTQRQLVPTPLR